MRHQAPSLEQPLAYRGRLAARGDDRDETVAAVAAEGIVRELAAGPADSRPLLVAGPGAHPLQTKLEKLGVACRSWSRFVEDGRPAAAWPEPGEYRGAVVRVSGGRGALELALHACASRLAPGARIWVAGTNDEGGRSADSTLATLCSDVETVDARKHCRLYGGTWQDSAPLRASLADWAVEVPNPIGGADPWRAYPGVFAGGELDVGTRELLPVLPRLREGETALDFGAGIGVVSAQLLKRQPGAVIDMLEADAISLQAARHNVPSARPVLGDSFGALAGKRYHLIASNPPLHRGKAEHMGPLAHLVESAAAALRSRGEMLLVTQRQIPLGPLLERHFRFVRVERETTRFRVWKAA